MTPYEREAFLTEEEFDRWYKVTSYKVLPSEDRVIPLHYRVYRAIALAAWRESKLREELSQIMKETK